MAVIPESDRIGPRSINVGLSLIIIITIAVYSFVATRHPLLGDEAVHGLGGRNILAGDWHLADGQRVMKPFMVYYLLAFFQWIAGGMDIGGRFGGILASCGGILFLFGMGRRWFGQLTALIAAAIYAFGPLVIEELQQAKPEPFYMFFLIGAAYFASSKRSFLTGLFFSLAFCTKSQAAFFLPMTVILLYLCVSLPGNRGKPRQSRHKTFIRFSLGTVPPLIILVVWSTFTRIPFAWLVPELSQTRYTTAKLYPFGFKLASWINVSGELIGSVLLQVIALIAVPCCFVFVLKGWICGSYRLRDRPDLAALALFAGTVIFGTLMHCMPNMPLYDRYMVPHAPWLALVLAWSVVWAFDRTALHLKLAPGGRARAAAASIVILGISQALSVGLFLREDSSAKKCDGVPGAVRYIATHGKPGAIVFSSLTKPEFGYYTFQSGVDYECNKNDPQFLNRLIRRHRNRDMYLFMNTEEWRDLAFMSKTDPTFRRKWRQMLRVLEQFLKPTCRLERVWTDESRHAFLYRIVLPPRKSAIN